MNAVRYAKQLEALMDKFDELIELIEADGFCVFDEADDPVEAAPRYTVLADVGAGEGG